MQTLFYPRFYGFMQTLFLTKVLCELFFGSVIQISDLHIMMSSKYELHKDVPLHSNILRQACPQIIEYEQVKIKHIASYSPVIVVVQLPKSIVIISYFEIELIDFEVYLPKVNAIPLFASKALRYMFAYNSFHTSPTIMCFRILIHFRIFRLASPGCTV